MTPQHGTPGLDDCLRTSLACLLDMPRDDVPHFNAPGGGGGRAAVAWVRERGYELVSVPVRADDLADFLADQQAGNPDLHYLLAGTTPTPDGPGGHVVIFRGGVCVWDIDPGGAGLTGPDRDGFYWVHLLAARV